MEETPITPTAPPKPTQPPMGGSTKRECNLTLVAGVKRIGKSNETLRHILESYIRDNLKTGKHGLKCLIFDINNEYGGYELFCSDKKVRMVRVPILDSSKIKQFNMQRVVEVRRIVPSKEKKPDGTLIADDDQATEELLLKVVKDFRGGLLFIDDLNTVFGDSLPKKFAGLLSNNAHRNADILLQVQSIGRILPKMWQNTNYVRFHHQLDSVDDSQDKLTTHYEIFKIAQLLVDERYYNGEKRFFVWVDRDDFKIKGAYTAQQLEAAIDEYISVKSSVLKPFLDKKDGNGSKVYTYPQAVQMKRKQLFDKFYGNNNGNVQQRKKQGSPQQSTDRGVEPNR